MKYKMTFGNHLRVLELLAIVIIGTILFIWYQNRQNNFDTGLRDALLFFVLLNILPVLYLHIEYYIHNKKTRLEIDSYKQELIYTDKTGTTKIYGFDDLSKILIYMPPHFHSNTMFIRVPFDTYHYARIFTKDGKEIIITCLLARKVNDAVGSIRGVPTEKKKRLFASILIR